MCTVQLGILEKKGGGISSEHSTAYARLKDFLQSRYLKNGFTDLQWRISFLKTKFLVREHGQRDRLATGRNVTCEYIMYSRSEYLHVRIDP